MQKILFLGLFFSCVFSAKAQQQGGSWLLKLMKTPATIGIDFGFSPITNPLPAGLEQDVWGSRTFNVSFQFRARLGNFGLSWHPGLGVGNDNYAWNTNRVLGLDQSLGKLVVFNPSLFPNPSLGQKIIKSKIAATYLDIIPLELRWASGRGRKVFRVTAGGKIGVLLDSHSKLVYEQFGKEYTSKLKGDWYLEAWRYGVYARVGYNWYNLFFYYGLSDVFQADRWASGTSHTRPITVGISLVSF